MSIGSTLATIAHMLPLHAQPIRSCEPDQIQLIPLDNGRFGAGRPPFSSSSVFARDYVVLRSCVRPVLRITKTIAASDARH